MHTRILLRRPHISQLIVTHKIFLAASAINNINAAVIVTLIQHIIDYTAQRRQTDTTGDKQQILSLQFILNREMIAVRPTHSNLLAWFNIKMQKVRNRAAAFNAELHIFFVRRRGGNGKNRLTLTGNRKNSALSRHMLKQLTAADFLYAEGFYISCFRADIRHHANLRNQGILTITHPASPPLFPRPWQP